ncbi:D-Ala-D-Ala carboxypeptidase family metallohydrolase [Vibrio fluvialis]|uniref:D-Ala-D-Ala carboxypeptidase family metallohydrolase n=1 Tax=Vibrio fluvialis TaxID=676 RepID=UPI001C9CD621|nr:D-Ala-D-Ala carboxypeptidase family metallohydrolase [Vibrio fluvialis]MBY8157108.1 hypothetical protein [Vibrio fluvialis]MDT8865863.1 D-Ala-D-Ala carboxypeptidase family metallohydrolase [Vibrio fluvialis]MDT8873631.1 D-Ala-D-Ala carboxypeptidase family metallohydrolase [Vibrio fluvialis]
MYQPEHFKPQEYVSETLYKRRGAKSLELMDERILKTMDTLRERLGAPITINNWLWGGDRNQSGLRDDSFYKSDSAYADSLSQHKYGRAVDFLVKGIPAHEVRKHILENRELYPAITFLEVGINWVHIDCRNGEFRCWSPDNKFHTPAEVIKNKL